MGVLLRMKRLLGTLLILALLIPSIALAGATREEELGAMLQEVMALSSEERASFVAAIMLYMGLNGEGDLIQPAMDKLLADNGLSGIPSVTPEQKTVAVPPGEYTAGKDIPEGDYTVRIKEGERVYGAVITVTGKNGLPAMHLLSESETEVGKLVLKDGDTVSITGNTLVFSAYKGLGF